MLWKRDVFLCLVFAAAEACPSASFAATVCKVPFVLRFASEKDDVCVPVATRQRTVAENARAPLLWTPGPFGPQTCAQGFVWREAFPGDTVCVTSAIRTETLGDNALAPTRRQ